MYIRGLQKTTLLDFPGRLACTVFTPGCNFRCPFCYNRDMVLSSVETPGMEEKDFFKFLKSRKGVLDGVVVCGGEPTLQKDLPNFIKKVRSLGFEVKLDTNGSRSEVLQRLLEDHLLQFVSLDVKHVLDNNFYAKACGLENCKFLPMVKESINLLINSDIEFELRTTVVPTIHNKKSLLKLAKQLKSIAESAGSLNKVIWILQPFEPQNCLDSTFNEVKPFGKSEMQGLADAAKDIFPNTKIRGIS